MQLDSRCMLLLLQAAHWLAPLPGHSVLAVGADKPVEHCAAP